LQFASRERQGIRPRLSKRRILLVEDNESMGRLALGTLTDFGQSVIWSPGAAAALERPEQVRFSTSSSRSSSCRDHSPKMASVPAVLTSGHSHVLMVAARGPLD
jgi:CheY-like chemotaxis protein